MTKYIVKNTTILHNKKTYGVGADIELTDPEAAKLADYITPIATAKIASTSNNDTGSNSKTEQSVDSTVTTPVAKIAKSNKKVDKPVTTTDTSNSTDEATTGTTQQEITNDQTVQTPTN